MKIEKTEFVEKVNNLLGEEKELILLKGKMFSPQLSRTQEGNEIYYTFKLKCVKNISNDEYGSAFNTYYCVVPSAVAKEYTEKDFAEKFKNNEVIVICSANASTKTLGQNNNMVVNNIRLYASSIILSKEIVADKKIHKAINL
ncbi:MAG: hypothetical protein GYA02_16750 [Clostridiaceae bacterium]|nr:hypothetical protein [Clostridiaceae bacterium]